jgi:ethanolamine utilization protein EutP
MEKKAKIDEKEKRLIMIGRSMAGKTTLCQYLVHEELKYHKTQSVQVINDIMIDTPGEFLERTRQRGALLVTAADADYIVFVQQANELGTMFPPGFSSAFGGKTCIGIVSKSDLATEKQIEYAKNMLKMAGAELIFVTSSYEGTGFDELVKYILSKGVKII